MKQLSIASLTFSFLLACVNSLSAQDAEKVTPLYSSNEFSDPAPRGFSPATISASEALSEAEANSADAGFSQAYFSENELRKILDNKNAVGMRFYNAMSSSGATYLIGVAINSSGKELNPIFQKNYIRSTRQLSSELFSKSSAKGCVDEFCSKRDLVPFTAYLSKSQLQAMLDVEESTGLFILPGARKFTMSDGKIKTYKTMNVSAGAIQSGRFTPIGTTFRKSLIPCPYNCPDDNYLLASPRY